MKEMQRLISNTTSNAHRSPQSNDHINPEEMFMNNFFERLGGIIPSMDVGERLDTIKNEWTIALKEANISTQEQLDRGLRRCRDRTFLPAINDFISWCKPSPEELGLPSLLAAFEEAVKNSKFEKSPHYQVWSHKAVYQAYLKSNWESLVYAKVGMVPADFKAAYEEMVTRVMNNETLGEIPKILPPPEPEERNLEVGKAALERIKKIFRNEKI